MKSVNAGLAALVVGLAVICQVAAQGVLGEAPEFLPADGACVLPADIDCNGALVARWKIADGY